MSPQRPSLLDLDLTYHSNQAPPGVSFGSEAPCQRTSCCLWQSLEPKLPLRERKLHTLRSTEVAHT